MIHLVKEEKLANICDEMLTKLIQDEANYDSTIDKKEIVSNYFKNVIKNREDDYLYIYEVDDKYVGYAYFKKIDNGYLLDGVYVEEGYRRKGIAKELIHYGINELNKNDVKLLSVNVLLENKNALALYRSLGFNDFSINLRKNI